MHKALHPRDNVDRLHMYQERKEEEDIPVLKYGVDASIQRLEDYIEKHDGGLITAIKNHTDNTVTNGMTITRKYKTGDEKSTLWVLLTTNK